MRSLGPAVGFCQCRTCVRSASLRQRVQAFDALADHRRGRGEAAGGAGTAVNAGTEAGHEDGAATTAAVIGNDPLVRLIPCPQMCR